MTTTIVFPGQGSQKLGMLADLAANFSVVKQTFAVASDILGFDLWDLSQNDAIGINQTQNTQPAMLAAGVATYKILTQNTSINPKFLAGHSLGEWTALVAGGYLGFTDAVKIVSKRAELMQNAVPTGTGAMAAILGLSDDQVITACKQVTSGVVQTANFNAVGQIVIAGDKIAVEKASQLCKNSGAKRVVMLAVSVPSHCALMNGVSAVFGKIIDKTPIKMGSTALVHNVDAKVANNIDGVKQAVIRQLNNSVKWRQTIEYLVNQGVNKLIECGPGRILTGLNKRIASSIYSKAVSDTNSLNEVKNDS